jgi:hypothetical protein
LSILSGSIKSTTPSRQGGTPLFKRRGNFFPNLYLQYNHWADG